jgi:dipeptidyl-peptidase-4
MKKIFLLVCLAVVMALTAGAKDFERVPVAWKWLDSKEVIFTYDGTFADSSAFVVEAKTGKTRTGVSAPAKYSAFPVKPEGAVNLTYSPDSTKLAFTRNNDLYVVDIASGKEQRLTFDGTDLILNGYASWVYFEEILGRPSKYKAFWWSPDSRKIGFYRFDNTNVPLFPIYSAFAKDYSGDPSHPTAAPAMSQSPKVTNLGIGGSLSETRYPKCGQTNPEVKIGIVDISELGLETNVKSDGSYHFEPQIVWADFDSTVDQYFGIPFWGADSQEFFIARMPRLQNTLDLYSVSVKDGSKKHIYNETYKTWIDWMDQVEFTAKGLYMVRNFETGWQQIYFLSYDGKEFRRLTEGTNWTVSILRVDESKGDVYFTAKRDASVRQAVYKVDSKGVITSLTDPAYNAVGVKFSPDGKYFVASYSNVTTPTKVAIFQTSGGIVSAGHAGDIAEANLRGPVMQKLRKGTYGLKGMVVADAATADYNPADYALGQLVHMTTPDGFVLPGMMVYPKDFDPSKKYPVHVDIYGGPDTPVVRDRWTTPSKSSQWWSDNGIIQIWVDPRAGGHNGRAGLDMIYRQLTVNEVKDFIAWADWLKALPYVDGDKIGVEGFSFGGTMTSMLLMQAPESFHYGIAGGGVYDWALYDTHYTERYMDTPQNNPEGYKVSRVLEYVAGYPTTYQQAQSSAVEPVMLKITHGTGDDNVHHQNTLLLVDALQKEGRKFDFMIYPDGMHGYRGYQGEHFQNANREFWLRYLLAK